MNTVQDIKNQIQKHPCFNAAASHHFGRIHLPVAPRCNIMCAYCNRRYDCPNESRPGVTSKVMSPGEATRWAQYHVAKDPRITVAGIAGPGDPLCNEETFDTLRQLKRRLPHLCLCLSTNGVLLASRIDRLADCGVTNITITLNAVDASIGSRIYLTANLDGTLLKGGEAAEVIIRNQLDGLSAATAKGMIVKVNTVLIPGINDTHLTEIAAAAQQRGAFMMNILPIIPAGRLRHIRAPEPAALSAARRACGFFVPQMRHCRHCRADSVGLLDQSPCSKPTGSLAEKENANLRVAVASKDNITVNQHFGHARGFYIYDIGADGVHLREFRHVKTSCAGPENCAQDGGEALFALGQISDCEALICARIGRHPRQVLEQAGLEVIETLNAIESELHRLSDAFSANGAIATG